MGALGAGFVALGEVWELWELDLSCLARFGSSRRSVSLTTLSARVGPLKNLPRTRDLRCGRVWESPEGLEVVNVSRIVALGG